MEENGQGKRKLFRNAGLLVLQAVVLLTVLYPAMLALASRPLIMLVSLPGLSSVSQGH